MVYFLLFIGLPKLVNKFKGFIEKHFKEFVYLVYVYLASNLKLSFNYFRLPLKQSFTINFIETKFKEILNSIETSKEFYFKPNEFIINKNDDDQDLTNDKQLKIEEFNFMTVYLFEEYYLNQFNNVIDLKKKNLKKY